jgi:hypothetical protein
MNRSRTISIFGHDHSGGFFLFHNRDYLSSSDNPVVHGDYPTLTVIQQVTIPREQGITAGDPG